MSITITWPAAQTIEVTDAIRQQIGRDITIYYTVSGIPCSNPNDSLDPITNLSTNQFCPICGGNYWIQTVSGYVVQAHVTYGGMDLPVWTQAGRIYDGDVTVQFKYTESGIYAIDHSEYIVVDGTEYIKKTKMLRGVPEPNRILVSLLERK